jgi:hypothetical protein
MAVMTAATRLGGRRTPRRRGGLAIAASITLLAAGGAPAGAPAAADPGHACAAEAREQARRLLAWHVAVPPAGESEGVIDLETAVHVIAPLPNPANPAQRLDVLEVWGYVEKAQYRMRLLYAQVPGQCPLVGQEIVEYASF